MTSKGKCDRIGVGDNTLSLDSGASTISTYDDALATTPSSQQWAICQIANTGVYTLSNANSNGTDLTQISYTDDTNLRDEWNIIYKVLSYVNYYDSTFVGDNVLLENISVSNSFSNFVFAKYFHLGLHMDGSASQYNTIADDCTNGINEPCSTDSCGSNCTGHHKNTFKISSQLYNEDREDNHLYVLWTNRELGTYCQSNVQTHTILDNALGMVYNHRPIIHVMTIPGNVSEQQIAAMKIILSHETVHTFGMGDVYNIEGHEVSGATKCIMELHDRNTSVDFCEDVENGHARPFCDSCMLKIQKYITELTITGNRQGG